MRNEAHYRNWCKVALATTLVSVFMFAMMACSGGPSDADVAAKNLSVAAEQFEVPRKIIFINGITDKYLLEVDGYCSVETSQSGLGGSIAVTCKVGETSDGKALVKKSYMGLSDNVTYVIQQVDPAEVSTTHYRVIFKPEAIVPDFDRP